MFAFKKKDNIREFPHRERRADSPTPQPVLVEDLDPVNQESDKLFAYDKNYAESTTDEAGKVWAAIADELYRYVYRKTGSVEDAEDILSEVKVAFWQSAEEVVGFAEEHRRRWLFTVANRKIANYFRKQQRLSEGLGRQVFLDDDGAEIWFVVNDQNRMERQSLCAKLFTAIRDAVSKEELLVLELRGADDSDWSEIADLMNISEPAARSMYTRVLDHVKKHIRAGRFPIPQTPRRRKNVA
jgi:RNA polymerase sigma factor (sigma-70 family)